MPKATRNVLGAWAFLIGSILAVVVGLFATILKGSISPTILGMLSVLGLIMGYFVSEKDVKTFLLASVSLVVVSFAGIQGLVLSAAFLGININQLITSVMGALLFLFIPATIVVALKTVFSIAQS